jgi:sterol desaturase/sphingolipid hydroxylase (fatty acid hydroxylase superfamily)
MILPSGEALTHSAVEAVQTFGLRIAQLLLGPGSPISLTSLACAMLIAGGVLLAGRARGKRPLPLKVLLRALFPRRLAGASSRTDLGFLLFNTLIYGLMFGWAIASQAVISRLALQGLEGLVGSGPAPVLGGVWALVIGTVVLFLVAELAYWVVHWLCHTVPFLWEFHKVHHSAEMLSPMTNFRVHPVEGVLFANVLAVMMGTTDAGLTWLMGEPAGAFTVYDRNVLGLAGLYLVQHLQHTHLWLVFPGVLGKVLYSPAHHQIHHSTNPAHYGRNLGSLILLWDWLFGTLYRPTAKRERLSFGLEPGEAKHQDPLDAMVWPVFRAIAVLKPKPRAAAAPPSPVNAEASAG